MTKKNTGQDEPANLEDDDRISEGGYDFTLDPHVNTDLPRPHLKIPDTFLEQIQNTTAQKNFHQVTKKKASQHDLDEPANLEPFSPILEDDKAVKKHKPHNWLKY